MSSLYITEAGAYAKKDGGRIIVGRNEEILFEIPLEKVDDLLIVDTASISSKLLSYLIEQGIPITWLSTTGKYFGTLYNTNMTDINKQMKQFKLLDSLFYMKIAKRVVRIKSKNQLVVLKRYSKNNPQIDILKEIQSIQAMFYKIDYCQDMAVLRGYEGIISKNYFAAIGKLVPAKFQFSGRNKRPPKDPFNAMLSMGYSMLFNEVLAQIVNNGLHPYIGFLHYIRNGHPALASDLMEIYRAPIVDSTILSLVKRGQIDSGHFDQHDNACYLNSEGRKILLQAYNKKLRAENNYMSGANNYREIISKQVKQYASALMQEKEDVYLPLEIH